METENKSTQTVKAELPPLEKIRREKLHLIDALGEIDTQLRQARQVLAEFYDDLVINEGRYPTPEDAFNSAKDFNRFVESQLFKLINEYPRFVTLLEVTQMHLSEGHELTVKALCEAGVRAECCTYVVG